tara:strand:- start:2356 stop:2529 length:174 start_codon:yes stop_codon:yes gene_type:complete
MYIVSGQALYRGASYSAPQERWSVKEQKWVQYNGDVAKEDGWGDIVSAAEAEEWKRP